jgi:hypothetical protein
MNMRSGWALILVLGLLDACTRVTVLGHIVKDDSATRAEAAPASVSVPAAGQPAQAQINRLSLEFTPEARQQVAADERFNAEALREAVAGELRSRRLLELKTTGAARIAEIHVQEFALRATSNVVLFGHLPSAGLIDATVRIREAASGEAREFRVRAEIPLSIARDGSDRNPLKNLYSGFARQLVDELTGEGSSPPRRYHAD